MDENNNLSLDDSFLLFAVDHTSTPRKKENKQDQTHFKRPPVTRNKTVENVLRRRRQAREKVKCNICGKEYLSAAAIKKHKIIHGIETAAEKFPDKTKIQSHLPTIVASTLNKVCTSTLPGAVVQCAETFINIMHQRNSFQEFTEYVCELFLSEILTVKFLLPSKLLETVLKKCDQFLSDLTLRSELVSILSLAADFDDDVLQLFTCKFIICFSEELLKFISLNVCDKWTPTRKYECDEEDRQTLHFIGGAILRGFYKKARRYPASPFWKSIKDTIMQRMIESESVPGACGEDKSWTEARDRGNLIHVSEDCLEFLVCLAEIIESSEESDGSLCYARVYEKVCKSMAMVVYWDKMISESLPESVAVPFLRSFCKAFCQTYGRGITKRKINLLNEAPVASISLRHQVARKVKIQ